MDKLGKDICLCDKHIEDIAAVDGISTSECLDRLLLVLWDALMLTMSEEWTHKKVSNLHVCEAAQLARYFLLGLQVGSNPVFDGICSMWILCTCACARCRVEQKSLGNQNYPTEESLCLLCMLCTFVCFKLYIYWCLTSAAAEHPFGLSQRI